MQSLLCTMYKICIFMHKRCTANVLGNWDFEALRIFVQIKKQRIGREIPNFYLILSYSKALSSVTLRYICSMNMISLSVMRMICYYLDIYPSAWSRCTFDYLPLTLKSHLTFEDLTKIIFFVKKMIFSPLKWKIPSNSFSLLS